MRLTLLAFLAAVFLAGHPGEAFCQAKHFAASQQHFHEFSNKASSLSQTMENPGEKNILNYYSACSLIYAVKAHALAQLADLAVSMRMPEDRVMARQRFAETVRYCVVTIPEDLRVLESMNGLARNNGVTSLGARLINELRVLERNAQTPLP